MSETPEIYIPEDRAYTEQHEWLFVDGDLGTIGITDYAQSELGDIVFVELPQVGTQMEQGEVFGTVEAVKTVADLYAPVSGEVVEINPALEESPEQVNTEPYGNGWMIKVRLRDRQDLNLLLSPQDYAAVLRGL